MAVALAIVLAPALGAASVESDPSTALDQADPRLRQAQTLLTELEIYRGPIDGRPNPALSAALLAFAQAANRPIGEGLSDALLEQLEASLRVHRLSKFLKTLGREQSEEARQALLNQPATRDLVAPSGPSTNAEPPVADPGAGGSASLFDCVRDPAPTCLIAAAVEASQAIEEARLRDWALSEIVEAQARAGLAEAARGTVRRLTDPRQIIVSLRDLAVLQAARGDAAEALGTARSIPETLARIEAQIAIAAHQLEADQIEPARTTLGLATTAIEAIAEPLQRAALRGRIAVLQARAGDPAEAAALLAAAEADARRLTAANGRATGLGFVATALAEMGRPADAVRLIADRPLQAGSPAALTAAAAASAKAHDAAEAERVARLIEEPRFRAVALTQLAAIEARQGDRTRAAAQLTEAGQLIEQIEEPNWRDYPLSRIALGYLALERFPTATAAARAIGDPALRAQAWFAIAHRAGQQGVADAAAASDEAEQASAAIDAPLDRCWMLTDVALALADDDRPAARAMLRRAVEIAASVQDPASRARAFSRIASVMLEI